MSKHRDARQKLIADTLDGDWSSGSPAAMAARAAANARRRYAARRGIGVLSSVVALIVVVLLTQRFHSAEKTVRADTDTPVAPTRGYTIISDQELLDSFAPLLILPDESGGRRIVLVDR